MAKNNRKDLISTLKAVIIAGYAVSLFVPYRVEKHNGETTYHAPLYKLSYKTNNVETTEKESDAKEEPCAKQQTVHTYTVTSFGLLNDQIATAKRLYMAALLKKSELEGKARATAKSVTECAKKTAIAIKQKIEKVQYPYIIEDVTEKLDDIIESIID